MPGCVHAVAVNTVESVESDAAVRTVRKGPNSDPALFKVTLSWIGRDDQRAWKVLLVPLLVPQSVEEVGRDAEI